MHKASAAPAALVLGGERRLTRQRREVYDILRERRDHPTATEVFLRVKDRVSRISLATVYNCLETLTAVGLVKQVNLDRAPSRYCPNLKEHGHFYCTKCGDVADVALKGSVPRTHVRLPRGSVVEHVEIAVKGICPHCASLRKPAMKGDANFIK